MAEARPFLRQAAAIVWYALPLLLAVSRGGADAGLCLIGVAFVLSSALGDGWGWTKQPEVRLLALLWLWITFASGLNAADPAAAFKIGLIWGRFVLFYTAVRYWLLTPSVLKTGNIIALMTLAFIALDTLWQYHTGVSLTGRPIIGGRLTGPIGKANPGNLLLKAGLPAIGLALYRAHGKKWTIIAILAGMMTILTIIPLTGERSTTLLMLLAAGVIGLLLFWRRPDFRRWIVLSEAAIAILIVLLEMKVGGVRDRTQYLGQQLSDFWHSPYGQLYIAAARLWLQHPVTGIGAQQFLNMCLQHMDELQITYCNIHPHNMYMEWLEAGGTVGFALFVAAMGTIVWRLLRSLSFSGPAGIPATFACAQTAIVLFPLIVTQSQFANWPGILFWYSLSLGISLPLIATEKNADA